MQEFEFIRRCTGFLPGQAEGLSFGIGDDCAVFAGSQGRDWLITADGYSEGIHFCSDWMGPKDIGRRCLIGAVSDIAAMGGRPRYVTISIAVPPVVAEKDAVEVMEGISSSAASYQMVVIGGDTIAARHDLQIVLTVIGDIRHGAALYRRGAKAGDVVYVTGALGGAAMGLKMMQSRYPLLCKEELGEVETATPTNSPLQKGRNCVSRFLHPEARISSGQWLTDTGCVTGMIDVSDGLLQDLDHMALASDAGMVLDADAIPRWRGGSEEADLQTACSSGEEYELAFTVDELRDAAFQRLLPAAQGQLGHPITRIGQVVSGSKVVVRDGTGRDVTPRSGGFRHIIGRDA